MGRTIVIGDVHGCAGEFEKLLKKLKLKAKDRIYQVGDLINRGPNTSRAIQLAKQYDVNCVLGNHEVRFLKAKEGNQTDYLKSYDIETFQQLTHSEWKFLKQLPPYIHKRKIDTVIVHAGFLPKPSWHKQPIDTITQIQVIDENGNGARRHAVNSDNYWTNHWHGPPLVIYGHTSRPNVFRSPGAIGIDTGCVYGGHLTAYILEDQSIVQVPAEKKYA